MACVYFHWKNMSYFWGKKEKKTCDTSNVSCKTIWWNKCKWIRNMWIVFQLKLMGLNMKAVKCSGGKSVASQEVTFVLFHQSWTLEKWPDTLNSGSFRFFLKPNDGVTEWGSNIQINFIVLSGFTYKVGIKYCQCVRLQKHFQFEVRGFSIFYSLLRVKVNCNDDKVLSFFIK